MNESGGRKSIGLNRQNVRYRHKHRIITSSSDMLSHASMDWICSDTPAVSVKNRSVVAQKKRCTVLKDSNTEIRVSNPVWSAYRPIHIQVIICCLVLQRADPPSKELSHIRILVSEGLVLDLRGHRGAKEEEEEEESVDMVLFRHYLRHHMFFGVCMGSEGTELFNRKLTMPVRPSPPGRLGIQTYNDSLFTYHEEHSTGGKLCMIRFKSLS
jgi:hypothetical protein